MAKVIGPLFSTEARGRVGGLVYNTWRGISYVKAQCAPAQPRTARQLAIRSFTIRLVRLWQSLPVLTMDAWNEYARTHLLTDGMGVGKRLTGCNWFVGLNLRLIDMGLTINTIPPPGVAPDPPLLFQAADGVNESVLTWTPTAGAALTFQIFKVGPHSPGVLGKIERAKFVVYNPGEDGTITIASLGPGTYDFFARAMHESNGQVSTWVRDIATVTQAP